MEFYSEEGHHICVLKLDNDSEESVQKAIIELTSEFLPFASSFEDELSTGTISFEITLMDKSNNPQDISAFWSRACISQTSKDCLKKYVLQLIQISRYMGPVASEEEGLARQPALQLALIDTSLIRLYTNYLRYHHMQYEVHEKDDIYLLVRRHGPVDEILELVAMRAGIAIGQIGTKQIITIFRLKKFREFFQSARRKENFLFKTFLEDYLNHYIGEMKKSPHWIWPVEYCLSSFSDLISAMKLSDEESKEYSNRAQEIIRLTYSDHKLS